MNTQSTDRRQETRNRKMEQLRQMRENSFSFRIKDARTKAGLTQEQLADKTGLSLSAIRAYETGKRHPKTDSFMKIGAACGVSGTELMGIKSEPDTHIQEMTKEDLFKKLVNICNNVKLITSTKERIATLKANIWSEEQQIKNFSEKGFAPTKEKLKELELLYEDLKSAELYYERDNMYINTLCSVIAMLEPLNAAGLLTIMVAIQNAEENADLLTESNDL